MHEHGLQPRCSWVLTISSCFGCFVICISPPLSCARGNGCMSPILHSQYAFLFFGLLVCWLLRVSSLGALVLNDSYLHTPCYPSCVTDYTLSCSFSMLPHHVLSLCACGNVHVLQRKYLKVFTACCQLFLCGFPPFLHKCISSFTCDVSVFPVHISVFLS